VLLQSPLSVLATLPAAFLAPLPHQNRPSQTLFKPKG
jgi:hypothetical protein